MLKPDLINKIKKGDIVAFRDFFDILYPKLMAHACRFVNEHTARDIVQDVFTSFWEKKDKIEMTNIIGYLYRWLQNSCLNYLNHRKVVENYEVKIAEKRIIHMQRLFDNNETINKIISEDIRDLISHSVDKLPPRCAEVFRMRYFDDLPHKDIAVKLNISLRTVEAHIRRAVISLRADLKGIITTFSLFYLFFYFFLIT